MFYNQFNNLARLDSQSERHQESFFLSRRMGNLTISLLGPPTVQWDGQPINLKRRLVRGLLFYLAVQKGEISRSNLIFTFWPDEPEEDARRHLRETLGRL